MKEGTRCMWQVYEFEDATNVFRHHQHSVGAMAVIGDTCKLGQSLQGSVLSGWSSLPIHFSAILTGYHYFGSFCCNPKRKFKIAAVVAFDRVDGSLLTDPMYSFLTACSCLFPTEF